MEKSHIYTLGYNERNKDYLYVDNFMMEEIVKFNKKMRVREANKLVSKKCNEIYSAV